MTQTILNLGTGGAALNGRNGSTAGADSNDALFLDWPGDNAGNYVYLPGAGTNRMQVASEAAFQITGDVDIRVRVAVDDWTPAATEILISKGDANADTAYRLQVQTSGVLRFSAADAATATLSTVDSSVAVSASDGDVKWVRVTRGVAAGEVKFFESDDGVTFTQLGVTRSFTTAPPVSNNEILFVGTRGASTSPTAGKFYRAQVLDGIGGTTVFDMDTSVIGSGSATSFTALTGQTVTISRSTSGRKSVAVVSPVWLFGTDDFMQVTWSSLLGVGALDNATVVSITRRWTTGPDRGTVISARRSNSTSNGTAAGYWMRQVTGSNALFFQIDDGTDGRQLGMAAGTDVAGRLDVFTGRINRPANLADAVINGTTAASNTINFGSLISPAQDTFRIGRPSVGATVAMDMELIGVAFFRRALSNAELATLTTYYQNRLS